MLFVLIFTLKGQFKRPLVAPTLTLCSSLVYSLIYTADIDSQVTTVPFVAMASHHEEKLGHLKLIITRIYLLASMTGLK